MTPEEIMRLRDQFATAALQGMAGQLGVAPFAGHLATVYKNGGPKPDQQIAKMAYEFADAMLKAREVAG